MRTDGDGASVVVITGGSSGIGLACAHRLGRRHALVIADVDPDRLAASAAELGAAGCSVTPMLIDVSRPKEVAALARAVPLLGRLRALVHAAGLSPTMADGRRILEVNLIGTALMERAFLPLAEPGSAAVFIASMAGHMGASSGPINAALRKPLSPDFWSHSAGLDAAAAYSLSKRGVILYCQAVVAEWAARGARIATVSPGMIATPMGEREFDRQPTMKSMLAISPFKRLGQPAEIAAAVEFLVSEEASFITGTDLRVDGGLTPLLTASAMAAT